MRRRAVTAARTTGETVSLARVVRPGSTPIGPGGEPDSEVAWRQVLVSLGASPHAVIAGTTLR
ncbi:hypothetical protein [Streptomyces sp. 5-10]|uniref:hypothetical protein n=1 Tax=Streptomyces sp. 5-10 TaxID=878925 RepID=UPI00168AA407|nr:hypothetical protein [Streptomyces sp. 5-10]MBD3003785.1 hypothetical protein [Streptomyces sp. 5-10]